MFLTNDGARLVQVRAESGAIVTLAGGESGEDGVLTLSGAAHQVDNAKLLLQMWSVFNPLTDKQRF